MRLAALSGANGPSAGASQQYSTASASAASRVGSVANEAPRTCTRPCCVANA
ncbi:Uncharacterised protein [Achromobacter xylosoxidans]|nr:Uncharacterised protein [Achromobacter xylosoxidans]CUI82538.1 Uncharacterised protein [Achromobacter xylosoxidans]